MAYCDQYDITEKLGPNNTFDSDSIPTSSDVDTLCEKAQTQGIDPLIEGYVDLPVTDTKALAYLELASVYWVIAHVYIARDRNEDFDRYMKLFDKMMEKAEKNPSILTGSTGVGSSPKGSTRTTDGNDPVFNRSDRQW